MTSVRVLVVDDSGAMRAAIRALLARDPRITVVAEAADGVSAVDLAIELRPDFVTMDVVMPRIDGLQATGAIMAQAPTRILLVCDTTSPADLDRAFEAIAAGALELLPKPRGGPEALRHWGDKLTEAIHLLSAVPVVGRRRATRSSARPPARKRVEVLGVVASTGGPPAVAEILRKVSVKLPFAVLVAQHLAEGFTPGLARWLAEASELEVVVASGTVAARAGHIYLPADGHHLEVAAEGVVRARRTDDPFPPSGDRLLASLAHVYGSRAGGVVLTGMGEDGARGLLALREAGGVTIAQEPATCTVSGMPLAAIALGAPRFVLAIDAIAETIRTLATRG